MILLDPDLASDPDSGRRPTSRTGTSSPASRATDRTQRLPSARTLNAFLREAQSTVCLKGTVSVLLTTDQAIRALNRNFRGKNKATDVLSFPASEAARRELAGDLAISVDTARKQGPACGHSLATELKVLILHGLLHLAGYDHETDNGEMARRERRLRGRLALPLGLIERAAEVSQRPPLATGKPGNDGARNVRGVAGKKAPADPSARRSNSLRMTAHEVSDERFRKTAAKRRRP